ncbi:mucin-17 isoform X2 [Lingula anatina]|nr:mucin-17 isoform X2 [Lingula anatina]|eukprot:XP_013400130.1 mucin-17 isoform X2 [Lingula anatina]
MKIKVLHCDCCTFKKKTEAEIAVQDNSREENSDTIYPGHQKRNCSRLQQIGSQRREDRILNHDSRKIHSQCNDDTHMSQSLIEQAKSMLHHENNAPQVSPASRNLPEESGFCLHQKAAGDIFRHDSLNCELGLKKEKSSGSTCSQRASSFTKPRPVQHSQSAVPLREQSSYFQDCSVEGLRESFSHDGSSCMLSEGSLVITGTACKNQLNHKNGTDTSTTLDGDLSHVKGLDMESMEETKNESSIVHPLAEESGILMPDLEVRGEPKQVHVATTDDCSIFDNAEGIADSMYEEDMIKGDSYMNNNTMLNVQGTQIRIPLLSQSISSRLTQEDQEVSAHDSLYEEDILSKSDSGDHYKDVSVLKGVRIGDLDSKNPSEAVQTGFDSLSVSEIWSFDHGCQGQTTKEFDQSGTDEGFGNLNSFSKPYSHVLHKLNKLTTKYDREPGTTLCANMRSLVLQIADVVGKIASTTGAADILHGQDSPLADNIDLVTVTSTLSSYLETCCYTVSELNMALLEVDQVDVEDICYHSDLEGKAENSSRICSIGSIMSGHEQIQDFLVASEVKKYGDTSFNENVCRGESEKTVPNATTIKSPGPKEDGKKNIEKLSERRAVDSGDDGTETKGCKKKMKRSVSFSKSDSVLSEKNDTEVMMNDPFPMTSTPKEPENKEQQRVFKLRKNLHVPKAIEESPWAKKSCSVTSSDSLPELEETTKPFPPLEETNKTKGVFSGDSKNKKLKYSSPVASLQLHVMDQGMVFKGKAKKRSKKGKRGRQSVLDLNNNESQTLVPFVSSAQGATENTLSVKTKASLSSNLLNQQNKLLCATTGTTPVSTTDAKKPGKAATGTTIDDGGTDNIPVVLLKRIDDVANSPLQPVAKEQVLTDNRAAADDKESDTSEICLCSSVTTARETKLAKLDTSNMDNSSVLSTQKWYCSKENEPKGSQGTTLSGQTDLGPMKQPMRTADELNTRDQPNVEDTTLEANVKIALAEADLRTISQNHPVSTITTLSSSVSSNPTSVAETTPKRIKNAVDGMQEQANVSSTPVYVIISGQSDVEGDSQVSGALTVKHYMEASGSSSRKAQETKETAFSHTQPLQTDDLKPNSICMKLGQSEAQTRVKPAVTSFQTEPLLPLVVQANSASGVQKTSCKTPLKSEQSTAICKAAVERTLDVTKHQEKPSLPTGLSSKMQHSNPATTAPKTHNGLNPAVFSNGQQPASPVQRIGLGPVVGSPIIIPLTALGFSSAITPQTTTTLMSTASALSPMSTDPRLNRSLTIGQLRDPRMNVAQHVNSPATSNAFRQNLIQMSSWKPIAHQAYPCIHGWLSPTKRQSGSEGYLKVPSKSETKRDMVTQTCLEKTVHTGSDKRQREAERSNITQPASEPPAKLLRLGPEKTGAFPKHQHSVALTSSTLQGQHMDSTSKQECASLPSSVTSQSLGTLPAASIVQVHGNLPTVSVTLGLGNQLPVSVAQGCGSQPLGKVLPVSVPQGHDSLPVVSTIQGYNFSKTAPRVQSGIRVLTSSFGQNNASISAPLTVSPVASVQNSSSPNVGITSMFRFHIDKGHQKVIPSGQSQAFPNNRIPRVPGVQSHQFSGGQAFPRGLGHTFPKGQPIPRGQAGTFPRAQGQARPRGPTFPRGPSQAFPRAKVLPRDLSRTVSGRIKKPGGRHDMKTRAVSPSHPLYHILKNYMSGTGEHDHTNAGNENVSFTPGTSIETSRASLGDSSSSPEGSSIKAPIANHELGSLTPGASSLSSKTKHETVSLISSCSTSKKSKRRLDMQDSARHSHKEKDKVIQTRKHTPSHSTGTSDNLVVISDSEDEQTEDTSQIQEKHVDEGKPSCSYDAESSNPSASKSTPRMNTVKGKLTPSLPIKGKSRTSLLTESWVQGETPHEVDSPKTPTKSTLNTSKPLTPSTPGSQGKRKGRPPGSGKTPNKTPKKTPTSSQKNKSRGTPISRKTRLSISSLDTVGGDSSDDECAVPLARSVCSSGEKLPVARRGFQYRKKCLKLVDKILEHPSSIPFMQEVDKKEFPDYHLLVARPMTLQNVRYKLVQMKYQNMDQFVHDMRRIFFNCKLYNQPECLVMVQCQEIEHLFEALLARMFPDMQFTDIHGDPKEMDILNERQYSLEGVEAECEEEPIRLSGEVKRLFF